MKTLIKYFFLMAAVSLTIACGETEEFVPNDDVALKSAKIKTVTVPFEVNLLGELSELIFDDAECLEEGFPVRARVEASGNATHMGKVRLTFNFCSGGAPDPNIPNSVYTFKGGLVEMIGANGDKLFLFNEGGTAILGANVAPDFKTEYWEGIATITGGTGRFKGASGELKMDDYSSSIDDYSHHHWTGEITLVKGKRKK